MNTHKMNIDNNIADNSCVDDSIHSIESHGSTINIQKGSGLRINFTLLAVLLIGAMELWFNLDAPRLNERLDTSNFKERLDHSFNKLQGIVYDIKELNDKLDKYTQEFTHEIGKTKETSVWLIRWDIISTIDMYEARGQVTENELKHLTEELEYYKTRLNGNHGVDERWAGFRSKMMSGKVKVLR